MDIQMDDWSVVEKVDGWDELSVAHWAVEMDQTKAALKVSNLAASMVVLLDLLMERYWVVPWVE